MDGVMVPDGARETGRGVVYPWLCDAMGHLATQHYMRFYDDALFHLLSMFGPVVREEGGRSFGWADVRHEIAYLHELRPGDLVILRSLVVRIGRSSIGHRTYMSRISDNALCSMLDATTVRFDLGARRSVPLEEDVKANAACLFIGRVDE